MQYRVPRREFLLGIGAVTGAAAATAFPFKKLCAADLLYPPMDLSYFDTPISPGPAEIHFGYASITWDGNDRQAIEDIAALGFPGIQLRSNVLKEFASATELRDLLEKHQLKMVALSSGGVRTEEVDQILQAMDPRFAKLELDVAHYFQGGGDPAKAIEKYGDRLLFLHIKDVEPAPSGANAKRPFRFVELGRGRVDLPAAFAALHKVHFRGWAIVELDVVPDKARTPKESGAISKKYLEEKLGVTV